MGPCILELLTDKSKFLERIWSLARNKAPGKGGIPHDTLMILTEELLTATHDLFVLRCMTGSTPASSQARRTVLLYKKEDPLNIQNYRPIALADTLTKLYTGLCFKTPIKVDELAQFREVISLIAGQKINAIGLALSSP